MSDTTTSRIVKVGGTAGHQYTGCTQLNKFIETQIRLKILHIIDMICTDYNIDKIKLIKSGIIPLAIKIKPSKLSWTKKN